MPTNYLSVERLSKSFEETELFNGFTFGIDQGQKVALVGVNGSGKSTLLKILAGLESSDSGIVSFRKGVRVEMLSQIPDFDEVDTVGEALFDGENELLNVIKSYELALSENQEQLPELLEKMDALNAWEYEYEVKQLLGKLGVNDLSQSVATLSGGQRKRLALAKTLVLKPEFLILDEPTNHLDLETIEWLENFLATQNLTLLMVTHDRYFLDRVTNEIIEIDGNALHKYMGNYSYYLEKKQERMEIEAAGIHKAKNLLKKELEWMRRQPKARGTKAKYRVDAFYDLEKKAAGSVGQQQLEVKLGSDRQGRKILELEKISKTLASKRLVHQFEYVFKRGDRIGIIGPNGVGKSSFLKLITGELSCDAGSISAGKNTKIGYYSQDEQVFDPTQKVLETVQAIAEYIPLANGDEVSASQLLNQFLFPPAKQHNLVGKLSGGERRRLQLLVMLMNNPNFIILDEPTNDFDIVTLNVLEDYLLRFNGCLLIVSHDRYFMDQLVDHLFVFEGEGKITDFPGNYSDYRLRHQKESSAESESKVTPKTKGKKTPNTSIQKLSFNEKREYQHLEQEIENLEVEKKALLTKLNSGEQDFEMLQQWSNRINEINDLLEIKELRWLELDERNV